MPRVSVIIPAYRAASYIKMAVDSVLAQTFTSYEIIIINDGCPETIELERSLRPFNGLHTYIKQNNKGPSGARNVGIRAARAPFIAFLDADDYWAPNYLDEQMRVFENSPETDMIYADALIVGDSELAGRTFMETTPSRGVADFESLITGACTVILSGTVVKRDRALATGLFDETLRLAEDYDLWLRLANRGAAITYQRRVLLFRRELTTSLCADKTGLFRSEIRVLSKLACQSSLSRAQKQLVAAQIAKMKAAIKLEESKIALEQKDFARAALAIQDANGVYNSLKLHMLAFSLWFSPRSVLFVHNFRKRRRVRAASE